MRFRQLSMLMIFGAGALASGCSSLGVKPWQRDVLSREDIQLNANSIDEAIDEAIDDHLYFSKEASSGGRSFAGGGCGCN
jgi:Domain of unknown function (DUF4266)